MSLSLSIRVINIINIKEFSTNIWRDGGGGANVYFKPTETLLELMVNFYCFIL
jgi:hypothetical protein